MLFALVADDEPIVRRSLVRALAPLGLQIVEAEDGLKAASLWKKHDPDIVFLDVLMPEASGFEVLKQAPRRPGQFVVLMSAFTGKYNSKSAKSAGADVFIEKPFEDIMELKKMVETVVKGLRSD